MHVYVIHWSLLDGESKVTFKAMSEGRTLGSDRIPSTDHSITNSGETILFYINRLLLELSKIYFMLIYVDYSDLHAVLNIWELCSR